jgi:hypothetical protein
VLAYTGEIPEKTPKETQHIFKPPLKQLPQKNKTKKG